MFIRLRLRLLVLLVGGWWCRHRGGKYCTAIVSADLDRTDNRFLGSDVLKGFRWFPCRPARWAKGIYKEEEGGCDRAARE